MTNTNEIRTKEINEWLEKSKNLNLLDLASLLVIGKPLQKGENNAANKI